MDKDQNKRVAVNEVARELRNQADRDYICARHLYALGFADQFMWQAQQALEKYLKASLLFGSALPHEGGSGVRRLGAGGYGHDLTSLLADFLKLEPWRPELPETVRKYVEHVYRMGLNRYGERHVYRDGDEMPRLDETVWHIRRWCRYSLRMPPKNASATMTPERMVLGEREYMLRMTPGPSQHINGLLESLIAGRGGGSSGVWRQARATLVRWNRWFYAARPSRVLAPRWGSSSGPVWARGWERHPEIAALLSTMGMGAPRSRVGERARSADG
jgi:HEPN domain-containing protein